MKNPEVTNMNKFETMQLVNDIKYDELGLHYQNYMVIENLVKVYNSNKCQKLHKQEEFIIEKELGLRK